MSALVVLDDRDLPWISDVVDIVERASGQPWRVARDQLERTAVAPSRLAAVIGAIRRLLGGRARQAPLARRARGLVLGVPVFGASDRAARLEIAARTLGVTAQALETLLWSDLPGERAIELAGGRLSELEIAATANVHLIQGALRRAQTVRLELWGDDGSVLRAATSRGLLATASIGPHGETVLEIVGPLAVFHRTSVYGRALGQLVPLLSASARFVLAIHAETRTHTYGVELESPVLLPVAPFDPSGTYLPSQLARALQRLAPALQITRSPAPIAAGSCLVCPDLVIDHGAARWHVEIVGFWTAEYVARKLERYREAGITRVIVCVDEARGCTDEALPDHVVGFTKRVDADQILDRIEVASND